MDKEKTSKIAERLRAISSRSGEVARDVLRRMVNATMAAQIAESPAVMTAAGQKIEKDGSVSFDNAEDPGVIKLRNNLPKIGAAGILGSTYGVLGPRGIARYALEGIDYTSPSHWVAKGAAKLGLGASQAYDLGLVSDMFASAYPGFRKSVNGLKNMYHGIGDSDAVSEGAKEALIGLGGFGLGHLVGWGWNAAANGIRKAKNLARIDDLKTLGEYDDIVSNLRRYHSGYALDRPGVGKLDNVRVEVAPSMAGGTADADYSGWSDIIRINPDAKHLQLGKEYTNALLAHEGTHAAFNRMPVSSQVSVDGRDYFMANLANPDVTPVSHLFQRNDPKGVGTWMASPEEYVSEMGFLRQLTGQNKRFGDLSPFYKNRFNTYLSNRFDFTPKESLQVIGALGKKYPEGGKFFRTNLQNESPLMYQPMVDTNYPIETPLRFRPQPDNGDYVPPVSTGMIQEMPIGRMYLPTVPETGVLIDEMKVPSAMDLFSDEAVARRALKQRYAESAFNDRAKSKAGAQGAWQIMPITLKDYLGRGRGKAGDLNDPEYNRKVRDWVMSIIPRDLQEFWSDSDSDRAKLAKLYAAYNWGAGNLRGFLRKKQKAGVDISNPDNWVDDLNPETRRYVKYLAFDEDIPDSTVYTNAAFEKAAAERGYAGGGSIHIKPSHRGRLTELKARTGKSEAELYNDGNPAHKKMVVFARNARKWKHGDGGFLDNYYDDGGPYGVIPLGGDYLTYLQTMPEVSGGVIDPAVVTAALPSKFNGSQAAAARYAEGYQKGARPVSEAMNRAGQDIFNTVDTVVGLTPTPAGALTWLGHMGADAAEGRWGRVGRDVALAAALGAGARGIGWLRNYVDDATNYGEDLFRAFTDRVPGRVSTNFTYAAPAIKTAVEAVPAVTNAVSAPYEIADLGGGYMLKSLMRGNPLEKQISKNGTVNVNNVRALVGKGSKVEQAVVDKVLASEEFAGKKSIDYNKFRKAVQDELITYDRTPNTKWSDYGLDRIGLSFGNKTDVRNAEDRMNMLRERIATGRFSNGEKLTESDIADAKSQLEEMEAFWRQIPEAETYTFSSSRIPSGSAKHYDANTLGHSRTYTTADEPDVLHVMESQSDWAQSGPERRRASLEAYSGLNGFDWAESYSPEQANYLAENFTSRQIQENLRYAAEKGQTKMRYPTRETAAKIEGYPKKSAVENNPEFNKLFKSLESEFAEKYSLMLPPRDIIMNHPNIRSYFSELGLDISDDTIKLIHDIRGLKPVDGYLPSHETILKKYSDFPKQFKKIFKGSDVRTVTDPKGNTWYEVDVPENYLKQEWAYEEGGSMILPKMMMDKHSPDKLRKAIASIKAKRMK